MGTQRNMSQMKEQENSPKEELNEIELSYLPDMEYKKNCCNDAQGS